MNYRCNITTMKIPTLLLTPIALTSVLLGANITQAQTYTPSNRIPIADKTIIGTQVSGSNNNFNITGGLSREQNLFHSFTDFSVPTGGAAIFTNPVGNQSIITRVTGNLFSDINGLVNTQGASFFLINPNGMVFGPNARLNVGKAFVGSTANGIDLVDGSGRTITFGTNPNGDTPLLSVNPNVFFNVSRLNMGGGSGAISNFGKLETTNPNQYIGLIGGNVSMNGGQINAPGGRVEIGGLLAPGSVGLGNNLRAKFPANVARGDVSLTNGARVSAGDIAISARNLEILGGSYIGNNKEPELGTVGTVAGDIKLDATGEIAVLNTSYISSAVAPGGMGKGGNIDITAGSLSIKDGGEIGTSVRGAFETQPAAQGNGGNIQIKVTGAVDITGTKDRFISGIFSGLDVGTKGNGGNIEIYAGSISLKDSGRISASTSGQGNAGDISVLTQNAVSLVNNSYISSAVAAGGVGNGGNIKIYAGSISLKDGATILTSIRGASGTEAGGRGYAGDIRVKVSGAVDIAGKKDVLFNGIFSGLETGTQGNGGNINIDAGSLSLRDGGRISASTSGVGFAGNVRVYTKEDISLNNAYISSAIDAGGVGKGGNIEIYAGSISLKDGAEILTFVRDASATLPAGQGNAGNISVTVSGDVDIAGTKDGFFSGMFSGLDRDAKGNGGSINIDAGSISLKDGARLSASTSGDGNAGRLKLRATNAVSLVNNADISSAVEIGGVGNGGNIDITTGSLSLKDGSQLSVSTFARGNAGNILLYNKRLSLDRGSISAISQGGENGYISIFNSDVLLMRNNSLISTESKFTSSAGGGDIKITTPFIIAFPGNNDIRANAPTTVGGGVRISIDSQGLYNIQYRPQGQDSPLTNDITSTGFYQENGILNRDDPGKSNQLPAAPNDASKQISQACSESQRANKFYVTGRGGHPPNSTDPLTSEVVWRDPRGAKPQPVASNVTSQTTRKLASPAVGWVFDGKGKVTLIAAQTEGVSTGTKVVCPQEGK
jgi:filamentous hemagglutinin family protein